MQHHPENHNETAYLLRIRRVLAYIHENLSDDLPLEKLSGIACFSPFHFQKIFSQLVGESPKQYIMRLRLERIAHYLKLYPALSISDASFQCGFSSSSTFIRAFKKAYGTTPEAFRSLPFDEISKIGTSNPNKSKSFDIDPSEFWRMNLADEEGEQFSSHLDIRVKTVRSLNIAFIESQLGDADAIPNAFRQLTRWAGPRELITAETQFIGFLLDMPYFTDFDKCRFRACITVPGEIAISREMGFTRIPDGRYASYFLKGTIQHVFRSLISFRHGWLDQSGYQIAGISGFELYADNPAEKPYESISREIFIPVKPA
ncbi:MAG: AraC family transcriptional regulator [Bacteroidota bacterium]